MAAVRQTKTGRWELTITNRLLPRGRVFFTFDSADEAHTYGAQAEKWLAAGIVPAELAQPAERVELLGPLIRAWSNAGHASTADQEVLQLLMRELGGLPVRQLTYTWAEQWVRSMKVQAHLAPGTIRKRVQALAKALDWHLRRTPDAMTGNPLRLLPRGYSTYTETDAAALAKAKPGAAVKRDITRERRLTPAEEAAIRRALAGAKRPDRERALQPDPELALLFEVILQTGLRLREAYRLRVDQVDLPGRVLRPQQSKLWRGRVAYRAVPMVPALLAALTDHLQARAAPDRPELLFPGLWDGDVSPVALKRTTGRLSHRIGTLMDYAGCPDVTEHDLRHEATCRWLELRAPGGGWLYRTEEVVRIMGWRPGSAMAQRYASFRAEDLAARLYEVPAARVA